MPRKNKYAGGFHEVTYTDGVDEVMVHERGDLILAVYAYRDASFLDGGDRFPAYLDLKPAEKRLRWKPGKNPLFLYASNPQVAWEYLQDAGFMVTGENED